MKTRWTTRDNKYGPNSQMMYIGRIHCGFVILAMGSRGDPPAYNWRVDLPGLREDLIRGKVPTETEGKKKAEEAVKIWLRNARAKV